MIKEGQLRRWSQGYSNDGSLFVILERLSTEFVDSRGGSLNTPAWSMLSGETWDWMYEVDLEEMSEVVGD